MMELSEAIRFGALLKPQGTGGTERGGRTCALGAALEAVGERTGDGWERIYDLWPIAHRRVPYPGDTYRGKTMMAGSACWILNDADHWTRERIADWVETIEQQQQPEALQALSLVGVGISE